MAQSFETVSEILMAIKENLGYKKNTVYHKYLVDKGCKVSYSMFYKYLNGSRCPSFDVCRDILDALGYEIDNESLNQIIQNTKNKTTREISSQSINIYLTLTAKHFGEENIEIVKSKLNLAMQTRGYDVLSQYISQLMKEDMVELGIINKE